MLMNLGRATAFADRALLATIARRETHLALLLRFWDCFEILGAG